MPPTILCPSADTPRSAKMRRIRIFCAEAIQEAGWSPPWREMRDQGKSYHTHWPYTTAGIGSKCLMASCKSQGLLRPVCRARMAYGLNGTCGYDSLAQTTTFILRLERRGCDQHFDWAVARSSIASPQGRYGSWSTSIITTAQKISKVLLLFRDCSTLLLCCATSQSFPPTLTTLSWGLGKWERISWKTFWLMDIDGIYYDEVVPSIKPEWIVVKISSRDLVRVPTPLTLKLFSLLSEKIHQHWRLRHT